MVTTLNMQDMRYLNLFSQITRVSTRFYFKYNEIIFFCVPKNFVSKAIGEGAKNIRKVSSILRKRVKVLPQPDGIKDVKKFIESIVSPVTFRDLDIKENEVILTAGKQSKAALLGRNKRRLLEMQKIISDFFSMEFKIV